VPLQEKNGITDGFHRKMKFIQRRAVRPAGYGFNIFENDRFRVSTEYGKK